jgi:hypothetical protein
MEASSKVQPWLRSRTTAHAIGDGAKSFLPVVVLARVAPFQASATHGLVVALKPGSFFLRVATPPTLHPLRHTKAETFVNWVVLPSMLCLNQSRPFNHCLPLALPPQEACMYKNL